MSFSWRVVGGVLLCGGGRSPSTLLRGPIQYSCRKKKSDSAGSTRTAICGGAFFGMGKEEESHGGCNFPRREAASFGKKNVTDVQSSSKK